MDNNKKGWWICEKQDCFYDKKSPRSKYCQRCASESHRKNQQMTCLKLIIKIRRKDK
jgi:hypothetical protein